MSHRIQIIVPDHVHQKLLATAAARESRPSTIAAAIVAHHTETEPLPQHDAGQAPGAFRAKRSDDHPGPAPEPLREQRSDQPADPPAPPTQAAWLQLDRGPAWRDRMWNAARQLHAAYPELANIMWDGWHQDRFTRDGILALTVWRHQLDQGTLNDPRLELQWLTALSDFARHHTDHRRQRPTSTTNPLRRPADW